MQEGYYWIQHCGAIQVAYYTNDVLDWPRRLTL